MCLLRTRPANRQPGLRCLLTPRPCTPPGLAKEPGTGLVWIVMRYYDCGSLRDVLDTTARMEPSPHDEESGAGSSSSPGNNGAGNGKGGAAAMGAGGGRPMLQVQASFGQAVRGIGGVSLTAKLQMALDVARGMAYLHGRPNELVGE